MNTSVFSPAGPAARTLSSLTVGTIGVLSAAAVVTLAVLLVAALKRKGTLDRHDPHDAGGGHGWIYWGGLVIPGAVFFGLFIATLVGLDAFPLHDERASHVTPDIRIIGRQWWWQVDYLADGPMAQTVTANELHIPTHFPVELQLESYDVIHSFWVPRLHGKVDLVPGRKNRIRIQADAPGNFEGQCAEYCGADHALMRLVVVAEPMEDFQRWLARQHEPAVAQLDAEAAHGQAVFEDQACGLCHTVRGTQAKGKTGPDLTHLASRRALAGNTLPNDHAWLEAWVTRAQSFKPGAQMPDITALNGEQLQSLTHYLGELR